MAPSRIIIAGASGLIGRALTASLRADGAEVIHLVRRPPRGPHEVAWLQAGDALSPDILAGADAVIGLNGASIGRLPWTPGYRDTLRTSRLTPTRTLASALRALGADAPAFLSASAVGRYGHRPGELLDEGSSAGDTFLAHLCVEWEGAAETAGDQVRTVLLRTASVVHPEAVLKPLTRLARLGLAGPLGTGRQVWPWISLEDEVRGIRHAMESDLSGPMNLTGPTPATAADIVRALSRRLHRPYLLPAPAWALRLGLGRAAADCLLLADADVAPRVLLRSGFAFRHRTAQDAIDAAIG
ncbi:TIGR01777 family oxidoreductase [Microbacterium sp.]|uniref:TIGR01777 family oxidoreductase n=1 Tax=Microbacterium sp. TaxID=51671 RepID=UPI003C782D6D